MEKIARELVSTWQFEHLGFKETGRSSCDQINKNGSNDLPEACPGGQDVGNTERKQ